MNKSSGVIRRIFDVNNLYRVSGYEPDGRGGFDSLMMQQKRARLLPCSIFYKLTLSSSFKLYLSMMALSFAGYLGSVA